MQWLIINNSINYLIIFHITRQRLQLFLVACFVLSKEVGDHHLQSSSSLIKKQSVRIFQSMSLPDKLTDQWQMTMTVSACEGGPDCCHDWPWEYTLDCWWRGERLIQKTSCKLVHHHWQHRREAMWYHSRPGTHHLSAGRRAMGWGSCPSVRGILYGLIYRWLWILLADMLHDLQPRHYTLTITLTARRAYSQWITWILLDSDIFFRPSSSIFRHSTVTDVQAAGIPAQDHIFRSLQSQNCTHCFFFNLMLSLTTKLDVWIHVMKTQSSRSVTLITVPSSIIWWTSIKVYYIYIYIHIYIFFFFNNVIDNINVQFNYS